MFAWPFSQSILRWAATHSLSKNKSARKLLIRGSHGPNQVGKGPKATAVDRDVQYQQNVICQCHGRQLRHSSSITQFPQLLWHPFHDSIALTWILVIKNLSSPRQWWELNKEHVFGWSTKKCGSLALEWFIYLHFFSWTWCTWTVSMIARRHFAMAIHSHVIFCSAFM